MLQLSDILDEGFLETMEKSDGEVTLPLPGDGEANLQLPGDGEANLPLPGDGEANLPLPADEARIMKGQYSYFLVIFIFISFLNI
jgi:hypothetical protein